jgi:nicotinamide mononucleotide transporter
MSQAEALGFALALLMLWGNFKQWSLAWLFAILSSALYAWVFAQSKLYAEAALQGVFIACACWGWWQWRNLGASASLGIRRLSKASWAKLALMLLLLWLLISQLLIHLTDSDLPYWDALPTAASLVAQVLLGRKYLENWWWWLGINLFSTLLFAAKGLWLTVLLYALLVPLSYWGWRTWRRLPLQQAA